MKFFVTAAGEDEVGIPSRTFAVTVDNLPEDAMFWDEETKQEARSTLAAAFAILLGVPCYVTFESDSSEELLDSTLWCLCEECREMLFDADEGEGSE